MRARRRYLTKRIMDAFRNLNEAAWAFRNLDFSLHELKDEPDLSGFVRII
ncbi:MAG: hypothetical protein U1C53_01690 [Candidatus Veblenbacteria bacterium]|nr:hypothetical protein [Candidatus Veblenbacteria bacterium]